MLPFLFRRTKQCAVGGAQNLPFNSYSPNMEFIYVVEADGTLTPIRLLNKIENADIKREKPRLYGGDD